MDQIDKLLKLFRESEEELLLGKYIASKMNLDKIELWNLAYNGILICNPNEDNASVNPFINKYSLSKYYKRLVTLKKIENG